MKVTLRKFAGRMHSTPGHCFANFQDTAQMNIDRLRNMKAMSDFKSFGFLKEVSFSRYRDPNRKTQLRPVRKPGDIPK